MNTQSDAMPSLEDTVTVPVTIPRKPAPVLVGATRIVGEPLHLYRAPRRRRAVSGRVPDQRDSSPGPDAMHGDRFDAASGAGRAAVHRRRRSAHGDLFHRLGVLLPRRAVWGTSRSQHPFLEVAAGFRSHHCAREAEYSAFDYPADHLRDHRRHPMDHAAAEQRRHAGSRSKCLRPYGAICRFSRCR